MCSARLSHRHTSWAPVALPGPFPSQSSLAGSVKRFFFNTFASRNLPRPRSVVCPLFLLWQWWYVFFWVSVAFWFPRPPHKEWAFFWLTSFLRSTLIQKVRMTKMEEFARWCDGRATMTWHIWKSQQHSRKKAQSWEVWMECGGEKEEVSIRGTRTWSIACGCSRDLGSPRPIHLVYKQRRNQVPEAQRGSPGSIGIRRQYQ